MEVDCEGCAGCCIDWRPLVDEATVERDSASDRSQTREHFDHERRGRFEPLDDEYNLVPLRRDEVRAFVDAGYGDALQPRLFAADDDDAAVAVDGVDVAAVRGRPAFYVGLRKPPKPVGPFGRESRWLSTCVFLDPTTLQCRIHGDDLYPRTCGDYPGENLALDVETECERVERWGDADRSEEAPDERAEGERTREHGGERLLDDEPPGDAEPLFGPAALGTKVFAHPDPERLSGVVDRLRDGDPTVADRAEFVAVAAASSPATLAVSEPVYERTRARVLEADSWAGEAIDQWLARAGEPGSSAPQPALATEIEDDAGAPGTPGWDGPDQRRGNSDRNASDQ